MSKSSIAIVLLSLLSLSFAATLNPTLNPTLQRKSFFVQPGNHLSYELYQTRNGIISHSTEQVSKDEYVSQYLLIDVPSKEVKPILTDLVRTCELTNPTFEALHHHVATDSLVFFCNAYNSLLIIDQSDYTSIQAIIPLNLTEAWPAVKLSTDGMNVAVLLMGDLSYDATPKNSTLIKVSLQTRQVITQISFNQGFAPNETVVAFASNKNTAYIATNQLDIESESLNIITSVYLLHTIGNTYQVTPVANFSTEVLLIQVITKLFCVGNFIVVNSGKQLNFIDQKRAITAVPNIFAKAMTNDFLPILHLAVTSQHGSNDIYVQTKTNEVYKYTVKGNALTPYKIGDFRDFQIVYGNQTSQDLMMFALDFPSDLDGAAYFNIIDLQNLQSIYRVLTYAEDLIFTNTTHSIILSENHKKYIDIFDLKNDTLLAKIYISDDYYYNQEQQILSFLNFSASRDCSLNHIDLVTTKTWTTLNGSNTSELCAYGALITLRITEHGNPEFLRSKSLGDVHHHYYIFYTESYGFIDFSELWLANLQPILNVNWDLLTFYYFNPTRENQVNATLYTLDPASQQFKALKSNFLPNLAFGYDGVTAVNQSTILSLFDHALTLITGLGDLQPSPTYSFSDNWEVPSSFRDAVGTQYFILRCGILQHCIPGLFVPSGGFLPLPGARKETITAKPTGINSYIVIDDFGSSFELNRFYDAGSTKGETIISI